MTYEPKRCERCGLTKEGITSLEGDHYCNDCVHRMMFVSTVPIGWSPKDRSHLQEVHNITVSAL